MVSPVIFDEVCPMTKLFVTGLLLFGVMPLVGCDANPGGPSATGKQATVISAPGTASPEEGGGPKGGKRGFGKKTAKQSASAKPVTAD
jgi:hypothetical protein